MQKNFLDHWIRKKYLLSYSIFLNATPGILPIGAKVQAISGLKWAFLITLPTEASMIALTKQLRFQSIPYEPQISVKDVWYAKLIEPKEDESLSMTWFWRLVKYGLSIILIIYAPFQSLSRLIQGILFKI